MPPLDWSAFLRLPGEPWRNFEGFVYELVRRKYGAFGTLDFAIGSPGVEFSILLTRDCELGRVGNRIGWQCKWYYPSRTLTSSRKREIETSTTAAVRRHADLAKYIVCTPIQLTDSGLAWVRGLSTSSLVVSTWSEVDFDPMMRAPLDVMSAAWFGTTVLAPDWFVQHYTRSITHLERKFIPELHVEVAAEAAIHDLLSDQHSGATLKALADEGSRLRGRARGAYWWVDSVDLSDPVDDEWGSESATIDASIDALDSSIDALLRDLETVQVLLRGGQFLHAIETGTASASRQGPDDAWEVSVSAVLDAAEEMGDDEATTALEDLRTELEETTQWLSGTQRRLGRIAQAASISLVAMTGVAGAGKSQMAGRIASGFGASPMSILLHGHQFGHPVTLPELVRQSDRVEAVGQFLEGLQAAAVTSGARVPIVIDALNDSDNPTDWQAVLRELQAALAEYPGVVAIVTVRDTFTSSVLPERTPVLRLSGFEREVREAVERYFSYFRIEADLADADLRAFQDPLFLRIFCDATNPSRAVPVQVVLGLISRMELFGLYLDQVEERAAFARRFDPSARRTRNALEALAWKIWETGDRTISWTETKAICGDAPGAWDDSLARQLQVEDVLMREEGGDTGGSVRFAYDALLGYVLASALVERAGTGRIDALDERLCAEDPVTRHPLADDILPALAYLLARRGRSLHDDPTPCLSTAGIEVLVELQASDVPRGAADALRRLWLVTDPTRQRALLTLLDRVALSADHPLNFRYASELLATMPVSRRDLAWTDGLRRSRRSTADRVAFLERRWRSQTESPEGDPGADWLSWVLTTTDRDLRDRATRALYWFGRRAPRALFSMTLDSLTRNDPYTWERMLAAAYGVAMAEFPIGNPDFLRELRLFAEQLLDTMLGPDATRPTTHWLARNYARWIVYLAARYARLDRPEVESVVSGRFAHTEPTWGSVDEQAGEAFEEAAATLHMDFSNYTIGRIVRDRSNYDFDHAGYREILAGIRWRIVDLGYRRDAFLDLDREIAEQFARSDGRPGRVERYGKKYGWIAFYEAAGRVETRGELPEAFDVSGRLSDVDIDPSFPEPATGLSDLRLEWTLGSVDDIRWLSTASTRFPDNLLIPKEIDGDEGPWVLVHAQVLDEDEAGLRRVYALVRGLVVPESETEQLAAALSATAFPPRDALPEGIEAYYLYAGEIPWSPLFAREADDTGDGHGFRIGITGHGEVSQSHVEPSAVVPVVGLAAHYAWESYHSTTNTAGGAIVPSASFCARFGLLGRPQTFDMYSSDGRRMTASRRRVSRRGWDSQMLFVRAETLETLLEERASQLLFVAWGERETVRGPGRPPEAESAIHRARGNVHKRVALWAPGSGVVSDWPATPTDQEPPTPAPS